MLRALPRVEAPMHSETDLEQLYSKHLDCVPDWIWDVDTSGAYTFSNSMVEVILGYCADEMTGRPMFDLMLPDDADKFRAALTEAARTGKSVRNLLHRVEARDGSVKTLESSCVPITEDDTVTGFRGISRDIVEELIFQRSAREALANYLAVLDNAPTMIAVVQGDRIVYRNPRISEVSGYTAEELLGTDPFKLIHPEDREAAWDNYRRRMRGEPPESAREIRGMTKSGEVRWLEVHSTAISYNGAPAYLYNAIDVTERKLAEDAIRASGERLTRQQAAVIDLTERAGQAADDLDCALRYITQTAAQACDVQRVSVWDYTADRSKLACIDLYDLSTRRHESGPELLVADYPRYFAALENSQVVSTDVSSGMFTEAFVNNYARPRGITSMMDAAVRLHGEIAGVVCFEHVGPLREWAPDEVNFAHAIANIAALSFETSIRAKAEEALSVSENRFRLLFERSPDMVVVLKDARFIAANPASSRVVGLEPAQLVGLTPWDISPEHQSDGTPSEDKAMQHIAQALDTGPHTFPWVHKRPDGTPVYCEVSLAAYGTDGDVQVQAIVRDVTERKRSEEERRAFELQVEQQKRLFYRETILSVTNGKLCICDDPDVEPHRTNAIMLAELHEPADVPPARHSVEQFCRENGLEGETLSMYALAVGEAMTNAIKHGVDGRVYIGRTDKDIWVGVSDRGGGIESLILPRAVLARGFSTKPSLGLGYSVMLDAADQVLLSTGPGGTTVILVKSLDQTAAAVSVDQLPDTWTSIP